MNQEKYWLWLLNIPGMNRNKIRKMLAHFQKPEYIYYAPMEEIEPYLTTDKQKNYFLEWKDIGKINHLYDNMKKMQIQFLYFQCPEYPKRLLQIPDPPLGLYYKGTLPREDAKSIAIIGARDCTRYGREMAQYFGKELARNGMQIISGLARGIDGYAHRGALLGNGYTLGVLGGGIDQVYPKENYDLFMEMQEKGCILSESNIGIRPYAALFPERNRLIAGFSDGILVVEAKKKSGTFITVDQGLDQGKDIFAVPGRIMDEKSEGCNALIKMGCHIVTDVSDILSLYHLMDKSKEDGNHIMDKEAMIKKMSLAPVEKMVYSCLQIEPKYLDDIIAEVNLAPQEVCKSLNRLVILGIISETTCNYYGLKIG